MRLSSEKQLTAEKLLAKKSRVASICLSHSRSRKMMEYGGIVGMAKGLFA